MSKNFEKDRGAESLMPPAADYDLPEPPVAPCTPEEYDEWYRAKVQEALDDPRPSVPHDEAMIQLEAMLESRRRARS